MTLGSGIALLVIGAILAFAVRVESGWVDLNLIGYILMAAGVVGVITGIALLVHRRTTVTTTHAAVDPVSGETVSRRSSDTDAPLI